MCVVRRTVPMGNQCIYIDFLLWRQYNVYIKESILLGLHRFVMDRQCIHAYGYTFGSFAISGKIR